MRCWNIVDKTQLTFFLAPALALLYRSATGHFFFIFKWRHGIRQGNHTLHSLLLLYDWFRLLPLLVPLLKLHDYIPLIIYITTRDPDCNWRCIELFLSWQPSQNILFQGKEHTHTHHHHHKLTLRKPFIPFQDTQTHTYTYAPSHSVNYQCCVILRVSRSQQRLGALMTLTERCCRAVIGRKERDKAVKCNWLASAFASYIWRHINLFRGCV